MRNVVLIFLLIGLGLTSRHINYPAKVTYVNSIASWAGDKAIAAGMGIPGYAPDHGYNYIVLSFWRN